MIINNTKISLLDNNNIDWSEEIVGNLDAGWLSYNKDSGTYTCNDDNEIWLIDFLKDDAKERNLTLSINQN